jgi:hypothetical protein
MGVKSKYTKGRLKFHSGAVDNEVVNKTSAASTAITNYGVTRCHASANATFKFDPPVLGAHKTIIIADTTWVMTIVAAAATINTAAVDTITVTPTTTVNETIGRSFDFYGASTSVWYMASNIPYVSTANSGITLT